MLSLGGLALLAVSAASEPWGEAAWTGRAVGSIAYLAIVGSAVAFVVLYILLRHMSAQSMSFVALLIPFGALAFGALLYDEAITVRAFAGAGLVVAGLLVAQSSGRRPVVAEPERAAG